MEPFAQLLARLRSSRALPASSRPDSRQPNAGGGFISVPPSVGNPGGGGYVNVPADVSRINQPSRTTGIGGVLGSFANISGFSDGNDAFAFGFNSSLKAKDNAGGEVTAEEIEISRNNAVVGATLASTGAGDFGVSLPVVAGVNPGLVFLGLAGAALVGYSLLK